MSPKFKNPPLSISQICEDGPPVRLRDLIAASGLSENTIRADISSGDLRCRKRRESRANSTFFFDRREARRWLRQMGFLTS